MQDGFPSVAVSGQCSNKVIMEPAWPHKDKAPELTQSCFCYILLGKTSHKPSSDSKEILPLAGRYVNATLQRVVHIGIGGIFGH